MNTNVPGNKKFECVDFGEGMTNNSGTIMDLVVDFLMKLELGSGDWVEADECILILIILTFMPCTRNIIDFPECEVILTVI